MRLLQVSLRSLMLYALLLVLVSIPVSFFFIERLLNADVDKSLGFRLDQFEQHLKLYESLADIETDLAVMDRLIVDIDILPADQITKRVFRTVERYDSLENENRPYREVSTGIIVQGKKYQLAIRESLLDNNKLVGTLVLVQALLAILLATGLLLLNRSLSRKLWKPFYNTLSQLKAFQVDKAVSINTEKSNIIEFDDLNETIQHLTERNRQIYLEQKEFIENASHELQTPLAVFQSKLDNLMQRASLTEDEAQEIIDLEEVVQKMSRLNKNLLLLSKIDNNQFTDIEMIDIAQTAKSLIQNLKPVAAVEGIAFRTSIQPLLIRANSTLIEVMLTNLFQNAVRHTTKNGTVIVETGEQYIRISNTGEPLTMDAGKMFKRFQKETKNEKSTGIGLAIVKKICDTNGYTVDYHYKDAMHVFTVTF
ncbi:HAMP domain-containing histidine kinase [Fulvivirgaceae bacterium PWU4]|uniref:histidine kinase n=1 Tax=Chryseosolibacter histidini TaxID=2782349 RepID=A0AAP2DQD7_9BACT|nr:HAMP domain-containing sensor histidine kinase [Chryseosolibacter histidini]MBT1698414.1 HAMP domain-containing histidine kinase [Chryseosolibacter histidini]